MQHKRPCVAVALDNEVDSVAGLPATIVVGSGSIEPPPVDPDNTVAGPQPGLFRRASLHHIPDFDRVRSLVVLLVVYFVETQLHPRPRISFHIHPHRSVTNSRPATNRSHLST